MFLCLHFLHQIQSFAITRRTAFPVKVHCRLGRPSLRNQLTLRIQVNATILTDSGGTCVCTDATDPTCATDVDYNLCLGVIRRDFITGTAAISALTSFCMGLFANMPIALAPGMGLNAYFTYTVVGFHGLGPVSYRLALTAVFVEGFVFVALSLLGLRQWLARIIPASIKLASGVGIGLYLSKYNITMKRNQY